MYYLFKNGGLRWKREYGLYMETVWSCNSPQTINTIERLWLQPTRVVFYYHYYSKKNKPIWESEWWENGIKWIGTNCQWWMVENTGNQVECDIGRIRDHAQSFSWDYWYHTIRCRGDRCCCRGDRCRGDLAGRPYTKILHGDGHEFRVHIFE